MSETYVSYTMFETQKESLNLEAYVPTQLFTLPRKE